MIRKNKRQRAEAAAKKKTKFVTNKAVAVDQAITVLLNNGCDIADIDSGNSNDFILYQAHLYN